MQLIDTHNHLGCDQFSQDRSQVLTRCLHLKIKRQIVIGITPNQWLTLLPLAQDNPSIHISFGLHPLYLPNTDQLATNLATLTQLFKQHFQFGKLCALGEIGLDYAIENPNIPYQQQVFQAQLEIATYYQSPVLLHVRKAHGDTIKCLKQLKFTHKGIVHAFSGSYEEALEYIKLGFKIGFGGVATYPRSTRLQRILQKLPLSDIVLETDAPDLPPVNHHGKRNSPEYLPEICQQLAEIKGINAESLALATTHNACALFGWDNVIH